MMNPLRIGAAGVVLLGAALWAGCGTSHNRASSLYYPRHLYPYPAVQAYYPTVAPAVRYVPVRPYAYFYYSRYYPSYVTAYYGTPLEVYVGCRQGVYQVRWRYTCYFPGRYVYLEAALRSLDLAFEDLREGDRGAFGRTLLSARRALPEGHPDAARVERLGREALGGLADEEAIASSLVGLLYDWSHKLVPAR